jgi:hypothetical protein
LRFPQQSDHAHTQWGFWGYPFGLGLGDLKRAHFQFVKSRYVLLLTLRQATAEPSFVRE